MQYLSLRCTTLPLIYLVLSGRGISVHLSTLRHARYFQKVCVCVEECECTGAAVGHFEGGLD